MFKADVGPNGIYIAYFSAELGTTMGIFLIRDGILVGADVGGGLYDGNYTQSGSRAEGRVTFKTRGASTSITGASSDVPMNYDSTFHFSLPLEDADYHLITSPAGRAHVRFERLRGL